MTRNDVCPKCGFESLIKGECMRAACQNPKAIRSGLKTNFRKEFAVPASDAKSTTEPLTAEEFEKYIIESGAAGSFMIYRNHTKKDEELGLDEM